MIECKDFVKSICQYDSIFLSETWSNKYSNLDIDGYEHFAKYRKKKLKARRESGGLVTYFKKSVVKGVHEEVWDNEDGMCFRLDKGFFGWDQDVFLLCVYMRSSVSTREDVNVDINCYELLLDQIACVSDRGSVCVLGDMNGRTTDTAEVNVYDVNDEFIDQFNVLGNENVITSNDFIKNGMSVERHNSDTVYNDYGKKMIDLCRTCNLAILNGRSGHDLGIGKKTFFGPLDAFGRRGSSTIDYVLCCKSMLYKITNFKIHNENIFSDHCLVSFSIKTGNRATELIGPENERCVRSMKWRDNKKCEYVSAVSTDEVHSRVCDWSDRLRGNVDIQCIDDSLLALTDILITAGQCHSHKVTNGSGEGVASSRKNNSGNWYDLECSTQHRVFQEAQFRYYDVGTDDCRVNMCTQRNIYRKMCRTKRRAYLRKEADTLAELSKTDQGKFWGRVKSKNRKRGLPGHLFYDHFKNLAHRESRVDESGREEVDLGNVNFVNDTHCESLDTEISMEELERSISKLKGGKAAGPDDILNEFIVNAPSTVKSLILSIFNSVLYL